jgi:hypothetical protein
MMKSVSVLPHLVLFLAMILAELPATAATAPNIWFSPRWGPDGLPDYMELFQPNAPWQQAASSIQAFEIPGEATYKASEADLKTIFSDLRRRKIGLVVGIEPVTGRGPDKCGHGVEGYGTATGVLGDARRIKSLGADPIYYVMDSPLYFGHYFDRDGKRLGCRLPIDEVAREIGDKFRLVRSVYPTVQFGDVEPVMALGDDTWLADLDTWFDAYQAATRERLAFFRLDMAWDRPWQQRMAALTQLLHTKGIPLQVIYNSSGSAQSDEAWLANAVSNFKKYESNGRPPPDTSLIQFWSPHPSHLLPESDDRTGTWLINRYVEWRQTGR